MLLRGATIEKWLRAFFIGIIGGLVIAWATPYFQTKITQQHNFKQKQLQISTELNNNLIGHRRYRVRLNILEEYRLNNPDIPCANEFLNKRKNSYVDNRDRFFDLLQYNIYEAKIYFSNDVYTLMDNFVAWQQSHITASVKQQPSDEDYKEWHEAIINAMSKELPVL